MTEPKWALGKGCVQQWTLSTEMMNHTTILSWLERRITNPPPLTTYRYVTYSFVPFPIVEPTLKQFSFYRIVGKKADVAPGGKRLLPLIDTRGVASALLASGGWAGWRGEVLGYGLPVTSLTLWNTAQVLFQHRFSVRPWPYHSGLAGSCIPKRCSPTVENKNVQKGSS